MSLSDREKQIAAFCWTAGSFYASLEKTMQQAEEADANGEFPKPEGSKQP